MRLIFINRFFQPDESATSLILGDLVFALGDDYPERHVVTSRSRYTSGSHRPAKRDEIEGVAVHRVASFNVSNASLAGRAANFLAFYLLGAIALLRLARRGDVVVCMTDPPLGSVVMGTVARLNRARFINWLQDIYPETANRLGYGREHGLPARLARWLRDSSWRRADLNVAIGERMATYLAQRGIAPERVRVIPNWADEQELMPLAPEENPLRRDWNIAERDCVVGYSGNLGRAHDVDTMLGAIRELAADTDTRLRFLFIGGGAKLRLMRQLAEDTTGFRVGFREYQPRERLRESLSVPDIHWLSLDPALEGLIVPSKFYGAAAVGRPILFIGDPQGEIARLIEEGECGRSFAPGQSSELKAALRELEADPELRREMGTNARNFSERVLGRNARHGQWRKLFEELNQAELLRAR